MQDWMQQAAAGAAALVPDAGAHPAQVPGRVMHLDGDLLCYCAGGNPDTSVATSRHNALAKIEKARVLSGSQSVVVHLTTADSTKGDRRLIATVKPYQGQRNSSRRPQNWGYLRDFFENYQGGAFAVKLWAQREADDGLALSAHLAGGECVIHSGDKDMRMFPGHHLDWNTYEMVHVPNGTFEVWNADQSKLFGLKWFWMQMLQGDGADHIPGLPSHMGKRVGEVRAAQILADCQTHLDCYDTVVECYAMEYGYEWADRFVEQAALLWMRRDLAADCANFLEYMPAYAAGPLEKAIADMKRRIKEAYAEAEKLRSGGLPQE